MVRGDSETLGHAGSAVLDLQHLDKYTAGDEVLRCELLSLFSEQLAQQITALRGGCQGDDWMIATHTLKGAARAIGAFQIGETAEALEISSATVKRGWSLARSWLYRELRTTAT